MDKELIPALQTAIGPAILISGSGLLLLTMTNRLARTIDRARALAGHSQSSEAQQGQLAILWSRARTLRLSIILASLSVLCAASLIILLFVTVLKSAELSWLVGALFIACLLLLISSVGLFVHDVNQSLEALRIEMKKKGDLV